MDGAELDLEDETFDAVLCRFALMYFPDPIEYALREWKRVLRVGGHAAVVVYGVDGSPEFTVALAAAREYLGMPNTEKAAASSLGAEGVLAGLYKDAGYVDVKSHALTLPVQMESAGGVCGLSAKHLADIEGVARFAGCGDTDRRVGGD